MEAQKRRTIFPGSDSAQRGMAQKRKAPENAARTPSSFARPPFQPRLVDKSPWLEFRRVLVIRKPGVPSTVSFVENVQRPGRIWVIKQVQSRGRDGLRLLKPISHSNIVAFRAAYYWDNSIYLVSEMMSANLDEVQATTKGHLRLPEIATVCVGILGGLQHLHQELCLAHGAIESSSILFSGDGQVKICEPVL